MQKRLFLLSILSGLLLVVAVSFLLSQYQIRPNTAATVTRPQLTTVQGEVVNIDASWAEWYQDIPQLAHKADLVAVGRISGIAEQGNIPVTKGDGPPYTDFVFTVSKVARSPKGVVQDGQSVIVRQTGGVVSGRIFQVKDDPLFQVGEEAVLFLHEYAPGKFNILGGPSGRFVIANGEVRAIAKEGVKVTPNTKVTDFVDRVQKTK